MWSTGEGNGKPLQYSCLENPMNSMKRQKDRRLKDELLRSIGAQYATGDQWRNNSRKNEGIDPWQKKHPIVDVTGDRSKARCCKQQYCIHDPDNHDGVITHLEQDILECEVKWALESITRNKASGGDDIPVELFQSLKDDAVKVLHSICQPIWKTQQWPQDWKRSIFIPIQKERQSQRRAMLKNAQTTAQLHSSHMRVK